MHRGGGGRSMAGDPARHSPVQCCRLCGNAIRGGQGAAERGGQSVRAGGPQGCIQLRLGEDDRVLAGHCG